MSLGLVLEGGGLRGLFTAGVIDVLLEKGIKIDNTVGVSAGAIFGTNIKSEQIGRVVRFNLRYCKDPRYYSVQSLLKTGDLFGADFCYNLLTYHLDPFDYKNFAKNPMDFYVVCTDMTTGKPVYHLCPNGTPDDMIWIRASASMPLVSRPVVIGHKPYLDGGVADPIPLKFSESLGNDKIIVVRTQPVDYLREPQRGVLMARHLYRDYPKFFKAFKQIATTYNQEVKYVNQKQKQNETFVIAPESKLDLRVIEKDPGKLLNAYHAGRNSILNREKELEKFLIGMPRK